MRKLLIPIIIILSLLLTGCGSRAAAAAAAEKTEATAEAQTPAPTEETIPVAQDPNLVNASATAVPTTAPTAVTTPAPTPTLEIVYVTAAPETPQAVSADTYSLYSSVISLYTRCIREGWSVETCYSYGVNYLVPISVQNGAQIGYCFRDVDGNGVSELIIGAVGSPQIYAMYTLNGSVPVQVIDAGERSAYYLEPDNVFVNVCSNSAYSSGLRIVELKNGTMVFKFAMIADFEANPSNPWVLTYYDDWNYYNGTPKSTESAESARQAYENNYVYLPYTQLT